MDLREGARRGDFVLSAPNPFIKKCDGIVMWLIYHMVKSRSVKGPLTADGGYGDSAYQQSIYWWDAEEERFTDDREWRVDISTNSHAAGLIRAEYVSEKCRELLST